MWRYMMGRYNIITEIWSAVSIYYVLISRSVKVHITVLIVALTSTALNTYANINDNELEISVLEG
jgi:hypothetical protein